MEKIFISVDKHGLNQFEENLFGIIESANTLIGAFHQYQTWEEIESEDQFVQLMTDPVKYFDNLMIRSVGLPAGQAKLNPEMVASLYNIKRSEYMYAIRDILISFTFKNFQKYLIFDNGKFGSNPEAVKAKVESFKIYAETPGQIEVYNHFQSLKELLSNHYKTGLFAPGEFQKACEILKFRFVDNEIYVDDNVLTSEILKKI